ncbi:MAG: FAD-binding oxidoreductase [Chlorobi bacterium]|nr:FAD-binding oxidoreductase [Chlorobiota bacterium]
MSIRSWTGLPPAVSSHAVPLHWTGENPFDGIAGTLLARGCGRSYGDVCLPCETALVCTPCDRIRWFDRERGIVRTEAGATLGDILRTTIPAGWTLPVLPGTEHVTVGGAIANDIHGKSHHWAGTFGRWVERFELIRSDGRYLCTPNDNAELFAATIGGLGLTGIVAWAELRLVPARSAWMATQNIPFSSLDEFFEIGSRLERSAEYVVGWCDLSEPGSIRGILHASSFCEGDRRTRTPSPRFDRAPSLPFSMWSRPLIRLANAARHWSRSQRPTAREHYTQVFFPLDRIPWNRLFGRRGFYQLQAVVPARIEREGIAEICRRLWHARIPLPLCVLKRFGSIASPGWLSFPIAGTSIAVDVPNTSRARAALGTIIADVARIGGRVYPAKDALMTAEQFQRMYPDWQRLDRVRDLRCCSQFWKRVTQRTSQ